MTLNKSTVTKIIEFFSQLSADKVELAVSTWTNMRFEYAGKLQRMTLFEFFVVYRRFDEAGKFFRTSRDLLINCLMLQHTDVLMDAIFKIGQPEVALSLSRLLITREYCWPALWRLFMEIIKQKLFCNENAIHLLQEAVAIGLTSPDGETTLIHKLIELKTKCVTPVVINCLPQCFACGASIGGSKEVVDVTIAHKKYFFNNFVIFNLQPTDKVHQKPTTMHDASNLGDVHEANSDASSAYTTTFNHMEAFSLFIDYLTNVAAKNNSGQVVQTSLV